MLATQDALRDAAAALPGVESAAHAMFIPFAPGAWGDGFRRVGTADRIGPDGPIGHFYMVSPEYFSVMRLPILRGRALATTDDERASRVIVVSETFARRAVPGHRRRRPANRLERRPWEIVGVAADVRHGTLWDALDSDVYVPRRQVAAQPHLAAAADAASRGSGADRTAASVRAIDAGVMLSNAMTMIAAARRRAPPLNASARS